MDQLRASVRAGDSCIVVALAGEADANIGQSLRGLLESEVTKGTGRLIIDLAELRFLDSVGVHVLIDVRAVLRQRGGELILLAPQPVVARVLNLVGADRLIPVYADLETALAVASS